MELPIYLLVQFSIPKLEDYLKRDEKLNIIRTFKTFENPKMDLRIIYPNEFGDWISQRNNLFGTFIPIGDMRVVKN